MEVTLSRKWAKSRTRGRKLHLTGAKARVGRARKTRADLEQQLKACRRVIAQARERLAEARKQQTATSEMLRIISTSPIQSVLDAVAENAARLCNANNARIFRLEDNLLRLVASYGEILLTSHGHEPFPANRDTVTGRATCDRRTIHVHDLAAEDNEYPVGSRAVKSEGYHTSLATPLLREGTPTGVILVRRLEVRPFSDSQIALLETFADQAVIAIENVRLFEAERRRTLELTHANRDLAEREAKIRRLVDANIIGIFIWDFEGRIIEANDAFLRMVGYDREDLASGRMRWTDLTPPELRDRTAHSIEEFKRIGMTQPFETEYVRKDGSRVPVLIGRASFEEGGNEGVAFVLDLTKRKRAEEALSASEERFRTLIQFSFDVYWESDAQHRFTRQEFAEGLADAPRGFDIGIGKTRWELPHLEPDEEAWRKHRETLDAHLPFRDFELARPQPDGGKQYWSVSGLPVFDETGRFVGYRGLGRQITERKRMEEALRKQEKELREILETIPAMTVTVLPDGTDVFIGARFAEYSGLSVEEARGSGWRAAVHPDDLDAHVRTWRASLASGEPIEIETRFRRGTDGEYRWFLARAVPLRDEGGKIVRWYEVLADIEDRRQAEAALRESEQRFRDYAEIASDWFWETGPDHRFTHFSRSSSSWGFARELIGITRWDMAADLDEEPEKWRAHIATLEAHQPFRGFRYRASRSDGSALYVSASGKPVFDANGMFLGYRGVASDVSVEVRADEVERALGEAQMELAHANRVATMGQLTASIAHEVSQPVATARNNASAALNFLNRSPPDLEEVREALSCVVSDTDRARDIIGRIRDHIKKAPPRKDSFDLNEAIHEVIALARTEAAKSGVFVQTRLMEGLSAVQADRVQLQQVVLNLILNAIDAMSSVDEYPRELLIGTEHSQPDGIIVTVRDSGPGIDPEQLDRVFDAFYTTKSSGVGMGLSICRSIIAAHGGRLWAEANKPKGAVFRFTLPAENSYL
jgi:PAS domain S-box-containing protein